MTGLKSRTDNSIRNVTVSLVAQLLITALQFITRTFFIKYLGTSYLGINGLYTNILTMLSLTELGLDTAINFKLYKPLAERDKRRLQVLMKFYRQAYVIVGVGIFCLGLLFIPLLPVLIKDYASLEQLNINPELLFILYLIQSSLSYLFFASKSAIIKADQKIYITTLISFFVNVLTSIVQIISLIFYKNFIIYISLGLLSTLISNYLSAIVAERTYPEVFEKTDEHLDILEIKDIFKDLGALFLYRVNNVVIKATDNIVLSAFIGIQTVGLYSNYLLFYSTINSILDRLYSSIKASMGNLFAVESMERRYSFFLIMNYLSIILYGTAGIGIAVCANELIKVWVGSKYVIENPFPLLIGIEIIFHGLKSNLGQIRNVSGVFRQMWFRPLVGMIINIAVSIWLVNIYGIYGVILGTITADLLANFMIDPYVIHKYSFNSYKPVSEYYLKNGFYIIILLVIYTIDGTICRLITFENHWLSVIVHICICGLSVPGVFTILFWNSKENRYLVQVGKNVSSHLF